MAGKRKDCSGRVLKTGESQRADRTYMFRYAGPDGQRKAVYAKTLKELREKEELIEELLKVGVDYTAGRITVKELVSHYLDNKADIKFTTKGTYTTALRRVENSAIGQMMIRDVKKNDVKNWAKELHDRGLAYNTISITMQIVKAAFNDATDDDVVRKNPCDFKLSAIVPREETTREILPEAERERFLDFVSSDNRGKKYFNDIVILMDTGMRIGELYGLTASDVDMERRRIRVDHQIFFPRNKTEERKILPPKSDSGKRWIPMTERVFTAFQQVLSEERKRKVKTIIDGYSNFLFVDHSGYPRRGRTLNSVLVDVTNRYNKQYQTSIPKLTAHSFRHGFCSHMVLGGMDIKSLQYLVGHAKTELLLDRYSHVDYDVIEAKMNKAIK